MTDNEELPRRMDAIVADIRAALTFLTRVPATSIGGTADQQLDFRRAAQMFPIVGAVIGAIGGLVVISGTTLRLPPLVVAGLTVSAIIALTGALHEDGLADTADGFGGGATAARKLEIMEDSRIGTFGAVAVTLSVVLRVAVLATLVPAGGFRTASALVAAEAVSRGAIVRLWHDLPPARMGGMADRAGPPNDRATLIAMVASALIVAVAIVPTFGPWAALAGAAVAVTAAIGCAKLFAAQIGGHTGDALGACQQTTATAFLVAITPFA